MKALVITIATFSLVVMAGAMLWGATSLAILAAPAPETDTYYCMSTATGDLQDFTVPKGAPAPTCPPYTRSWTPGGYTNPY